MTSMMCSQLKLIIRALSENFLLSSQPRSKFHGIDADEGWPHDEAEPEHQALIRRFC